MTATFDTHSIDCKPLGDIAATLIALIAGAPQITFRYLHTAGTDCVRLDTAMLSKELGAEISLNTPSVLVWIGNYLKKQYENFGGMKAC